MRDQDEIYEAATEEPATLGCPSLVPGTVVVHDEPGATAGNNKTVHKAVVWPEGYAIEMEKNGRKIVGVITESGMYIGDDTYPYRFSATVYDGDDILFAIDSCSRGISFQKRVLKSAIIEAIQILSHMRRYRANKKAKKGGAA